MIAYAEFHEIDAELFPIFRVVIRAMDAKFIEFHASKSQAASPGANTSDAAPETLGSGVREVSPPKRSGKYASPRVSRG